MALVTITLITACSAPQSSTLETKIEPVNKTISGTIYYRDQILRGQYIGNNMFAYWVTPASTGSEIELNQNNTQDFRLN